MKYKDDQHLCELERKNFRLLVKKKSWEKKTYWRYKKIKTRSTNINGATETKNCGVLSYFSWKQTVVTLISFIFFCWNFWYFVTCSCLVCFEFRTSTKPWFNFVVEAIFPVGHIYKKFSCVPFFEVYLSICLFWKISLTCSFFFSKKA